MSVEQVVDPEAFTITDITFFFDSDTAIPSPRGTSSLIARLSRPGLEDRSIDLVRRSMQDSPIEDLWRMDPDIYYGELLTKELPWLTTCSESEQRW